jgi:hypothetical protein
MIGSEGEIQMTIELRKTERGFLRGQFTDRYNDECSIQKSSIADENCIWLGCEHETFDSQGNPCGARMHLTQQMTADLIPLLQKFVDTGEL